VEICDEIIKDLSSLEIDIKIEELESQFSKDLSENTFNQIKELKKLQNIN
jgi:DNA primase